MGIIFYNKEGSKYYQITAGIGDRDKIHITTNDCEGGDFPADEVIEVIFNALDKYFKENF